MLGVVLLKSNELAVETSIGPEPLPIPCIISADGRMVFQVQDTEYWVTDLIESSVSVELVTTTGVQVRVASMPWNYFQEHIRAY